jgi:alpha-tubulin suppressor-like RCC1 family protein
MKRVLPPGLSLVALVAAGCSLGGGDKTACNNDDDCRAERVCRKGLCQARGPDASTTADGAVDAGGDGAVLDAPGGLDLPGGLDAISEPVDLPAEPTAAPDGCPDDQFRSGDRCFSDVVSVAAAEFRTCALTRTGQVWCWGGSPLAARPERVPDIEDAKAIALGGRWVPNGTGFACVVTRAERLLCWGSQHLGQLGDGLWLSTRSMPAPVITADSQPLTGVRDVALGAEFGCATTADKLHCWGDNTYGQLASPVAEGNGVVQYPGVTPPTFYRPHAAPVEVVSATFVGAGVGLAMTSDGVGTVCGWGGNGTGHRYWPLAQDAIVNPVPVCRTHAEVIQLVGGFNHSCLRQRNGEVACWGTDVGVWDLPGQRLALPASVSLTAGSEHACTVLADGRVFCWGQLRRGELGNGILSSGSFFGAQEVTALGTDAAAVGSGVTANHTCAIKRDGSLHCWGRNDAGQLGNAEAPTAAPTPVPVNWL